MSTTEMLSRLARTSVAKEEPKLPKVAPEVEHYAQDRIQRREDRELYCEVREWLEVLQDDDGDLTKLAILLDKMRVKLWVRLGEELHAMNSEKSPTTADEHWKLIFDWTQTHLQGKREKVAEKQSPQVASKE